MSSLASELAAAAVDSLPGSPRLVAAERLTGGLRNSNFKVLLEPAREPLVLRVYENDRELCRKEVDLHRLVRGVVPVPEIVHAMPDGIDGGAPFVFMQYIDGITVRELRRRGERAALADAASSIGEALAAIGRTTFPKPGRLAAGPTVGAPLLEGADPCPRFVDDCLATAEAHGRIDSKTRALASACAWSWAPRLAALDEERRLVHCDFSSGNVLVRELEGRWSIAAVLDWEFAVSASPLIDVGNFLRYEATSKFPMEPHFSAGFTRAGGQLSEDWLRLSRVLDLTALAEMLARGTQPADVSAEILGLIRATAEECGASRAR